MARVLILDDYEPALYAMQVVLESVGHEVLTGTSGSGIADQVKDAPPDILITDLFMPGQDGLELISEIRGFNGTLPIVAVCGVDKWNTEALFVATSLGANEVLSKPFKKDELLNLIDGLLGFQGIRQAKRSSG